MLEEFDRVAIVAGSVLFAMRNGAVRWSQDRHASAADLVGLLRGIGPLR